MEKLISKLKNWWWYHKKAALLALAVLAAVVYLVCVENRTAEPDYHVGMVSMTPYSPEELSEMENSLRTAGRDCNGDGQVLVQLHTYQVDLADNSPNAGYKHYEIAAALDGDLVGSVSGIFLLEDPDAFRRVTGSVLTDEVTPWEYGLYLTIRADADADEIQLFDALQK